MKKAFLCASLITSAIPCRGMEIVKMGKHLNKRGNKAEEYRSIRTVLKLSNQGYLPDFPKGKIYLFTPEEEQDLCSKIFINDIACESIFMTIYDQINTKKEDRICTLRTALELPILTEYRSAKLKTIGGTKCSNSQCFENNSEFQLVKNKVEKGEITLTQIIKKIRENK